MAWSMRGRIAGLMGRWGRSSVRIQTVLITSSFVDAFDHGGGGFDDLAGELVDAAGGKHGLPGADRADLGPLVWMATGARQGELCAG